MVFVVCPLWLDKLLSVCLEIRAINLKLSCLCIYTVHVHVCGTWIICVEGASMDILTYLVHVC